MTATAITFKTEQKVTTNLTGPGSRLTVTGLFQLLQESATEHAETMGWGYDAMTAKGLGWLLSRMKVEINRMPLWNENLEIRTAPYVAKGPLAPRDFQILSCEGELLIQATSQWMAINRNTMRPMPPKVLFEDIKLTAEEGLCSLSIAKVRGEWYENPIDERCVYASHLDLNDHMNNTRYVDFITDSLSPKERETLRSLEMHYLQEAKEGDRISVFAGTDKEGNSLRKLQRGDTAVLTARLTWNKDKAQ